MKNQIYYDKALVCEWKNRAYANSIYAKAMRDKARCALEGNIEVRISIERMMNRLNMIYYGTESTNAISIQEVVKILAEAV